MWGTTDMGDNTGLGNGVLWYDLRWEPIIKWYLLGTCLDVIALNKSHLNW